MNAQRAFYQVGTRSRVSHSMRAGALAPGGAELPCPSRKFTAAGASKLNPARGQSRNVLALAAHAQRDGHTGSTPPSPVEVWDAQERIPTWFIIGSRDAPSPSTSCPVPPLLISSF